MKGYFREFSVALALGILLLALAFFAPRFFALQPLLSRLTAQSPVLVVAIGMTLVMISREIDISVGAQFGMCAVIAGLLTANGSSLFLATIGAIGAGLVMGMLNGALVASLGLPSIVVTLATMVTWQEALRLWQQGKLLSLPHGVQWFGMSQKNGQVSLIIFSVALFAIAAWIMRNITAGRRIYAVGSDAEAARLAGINPKRMTFGVFALMGSLTGLAAVMSIVQSPQVQPNCGDGLEMKVIAACVVGGVAVSGGRGRLWGVFPGLLLLANVNPALTHFHVQAYWEKAIQGLVVLLAVVAESVRNRRTGMGNDK